jgi:colanic acid/amylovoran biosynthesis glycosyltransferase
MATLVLFTDSYPYGHTTEKPFLDPEMEHLVAHFERVIVVPGSPTGSKQAVSAGVEVEDSFASIRQASYRNMRTLVRTIFSSLFDEDVLKWPAILLRPAALRKLIGCIASSKRTRNWVLDFVERERLDPGRCVFYTYWLGERSLGIGLAKKQCPQIKLVSRAHGSDLYEERHPWAYIPCRRHTLGLLDRLFLVSENGEHYVAGQYPRIAPVCETSRLGVRDPGFVTAQSCDGTFRIVSCSFMRPVKRNDLLVEGIGQAARLRPEQSFEWHHFGDGPLYETIVAMAQSALPANVRSHFVGAWPNEQIMAFYKDQPVDLFMNVSASEGIPVSIMEAASYGIPIVATAVGGTPEIVSDQNGHLLSANPTPDEIARAIYSILDNSDSAAQKRKESRRIWQERYNAGRNFQAFAERLRSLVQ